MDVEKMTDQEILDLTPEKIDKIIKLTFAENGIQIVARPQEPAYHVIEPADHVLFEVQGVDALFADEQTAIAVRDVMQNSFSKLRKKSGWGDDAHEEQFYPSYDKSKTTLQIEKVTVYSRELFAKMQGMMRQNSEAEASYKALLKEYEKAHDAGQSYVDAIWDKINTVRKKYDNFEKMFIHYKEYLSLADGAEETAWAFLKKAFSVDEETEKWVRAKLIESK